jgi:hypothetical protein
MERPLTRITPAAPSAAFKTYQIAAPVSSHWRSASCAEVDCPAHQYGWSTTVDTATDLGQGQAYYIRRESGRSYREEQVGPGMVRFTFGPGQRCFRADTHRVRTGRPEIFAVRGGDWRGNPTGDKRQHQSPDDWLDDFATHQQYITDRRERG